jgi:AraC-like DNA-binding protein
MEYRETPPVPELAGIVRCLWTLTGRAEALDGGTQPILPDGCPEIVLHRGEPFARLSDRGPEPQALTLFAGQLDKALTLRPQGRIEVIGVRFQPFGAATVVAAPQHTLVGETTDLAAVSPRLARALSSAAEDPTLAGAVGRVQRVLAEWCDVATIDPRVRAAVTLIGATNGRVAVGRLAEAAGLTRRHLERRFVDTVGLTPKRLARIVRFQRALALLERCGPARRGTDTAFACGYADQAHFIRDFRKLAGCAPGEHLLRQGELTGFFVNRDRSRLSTR